MAHTKAQGSAKNVHDSPGKRLGVKKFGGQTVKAGNIIIRQRGNKYFAGPNIVTGKDYTLLAETDGQVRFYKKSQVKFNGRRYENTFVTVDPVETKKAAKA